MALTEVNKREGVNVLREQAESIFRDASQQPRRKWGEAHYSRRSTVLKFAKKFEIIM